MEKFNRFALVLGLVAGLVCAGFGKAGAVDFSVAVASGSPRDSAADFTRISGVSGTPTGNLFLRNLQIGNYLGASVQNVSVWDTCTSSTAATLRMVIPVAASSTWPTGGHEPFPANLYQLSDPCFSKTDANSTVNLFGIYQ